MPAARANRLSGLALSVNVESNGGPPFSGGAFGGVTGNPPDAASAHDGGVGWNC